MKSSEELFLRRLAWLEARKAKREEAVAKVAAKAASKLQYAMAGPTKEFYLKKRFVDDKHKAFDVERAAIAKRAAMVTGPSKSSYRNSLGAFLDKARVAREKEPGGD
jgi:hypothetical protein